MPRRAVADLFDTARLGEARDRSKAGREDDAEDSLPDIAHLSQSIRQQETVVTSLQAKIAAILSELSAVLSASVIEQSSMQYAVETGKIGELLAQEGALLASLPPSAPPMLIMNLRARRSDLAQAIVQLGQLRSQIAQAESRLAAAIASSRSRTALG